MKNINRLWWLFLVGCILSACAAPPRVAVEERNVLTVRQETEKMGGQLIRFAQPGDTLHGIAFVAGLDVNKLAAWNGIHDTSKLNVGQRIRLTEPIDFSYPAPEPIKQTANVPSSSLPTDRVLEVEPLPRRKPPIAESGAKNDRPQKSAPQTSERASVPATPSAEVQREPFAKIVRWHWPTDGEVITKFAIPQGRQGIDIKAERGQAVMATDRGEVVYVGNSLKGYGNLIIVKHTDEYLSAYAHNQNIFVSEGQSVSALQKIGSIGMNRRRQTALHFQIRKNGKPVNPLLYLPKTS